MGSHKKHKYYKKKSKKGKRHKKEKINLKAVQETLKADRKYSNLISTLSIKDKRTSVEKRSRSESPNSSYACAHGGGGDRRKIKYKHKKSRSSSVTSSSSLASSSSSSSASSSASSSSDEKSRGRAKHRKKKLKRAEKKKKIDLLNRKHEEAAKARSDDGLPLEAKKNEDDFSYDKKKRMKKMKLSHEPPGAALPDCVLTKSRAMAPVSREEWERRQSEIRRVYDQETGRYRLIKGDGEVLEEIVSRSRHKEINKQATLGDGNFFQSTIASQIRK